MEYKKRFTTVRELLDSEEFKNKDLSYCDVSYLDLSSISEQKWEGFKFFHTNFRCSNIQFDPNTLAVNEDMMNCLEYCDFTGCDLSHITAFFAVSFKGSIFKGSHLSIKLHLSIQNIEDVVFSEEMADDLRSYAGSEYLNIATIEINPHIPFSSFEILNVVSAHIPQSNNFIPSSHIEEYNDLINRALEEDKNREGLLYRLYTLVGIDDSNAIERIKFCQGFIRDKVYDKLDLSSIPHNLLGKFHFRNCQIEELTLPPEDMQWFSIQNEDIKRTRITTIPHIIIAGQTASSWQAIRNKRLGRTCHTRQTNLYLELGRKCNAKCAFCRNHLLKKCRFSIANVMRTFRTIEPHLHNVVIGGGEPTLPQTRDYLEQIRNSRRNYDIEYFISTNGSAGVDYLIELANHFGYRINLSRHAIEDAENEKIFGIKTIGTEDIREFIIRSYYSDYLTLVATCFKGGLDSVEALERYIELSDYLHVRSILFQSLHEDLDGGLEKVRQIDEMVFDELISRLREQGYFVSELPIYSTGDYKLIIVKSSDNRKTISFKRYITKEELNSEWYRSSKRTFDLSLAPNGDLFQNWHQSSDKVLCYSPKEERKK